MFSMRFITSFSKDFISKMVGGVLLEGIEVRKDYFGRKFYLLLGKNELSISCVLVHFPLSQSNFSNKLWWYRNVFQ